LVAALVLASSSAWGAIIVTTADGNGADTMLQNDSQDAGTGPDVIRGGIDTMTVRYVAASRVKISYVRFDLSDVAGDRSDATLTLQMTLNNGNRVRAINVYGLTDDDADDAWPEASTSYSNAPGFIYTDPDLVTPGNQPSNDFTIDGLKMTLLGTVTTPGGIGLMTSTTAALNLNSFLANDTNDLVTLALVRVDSDSNVDFRFATKENVTAGITFPTLTLPNARLVPEPSSIVLAMTFVAAIGVGARRRR
jgi:hypothetical protein